MPSFASLSYRGGLGSLGGLSRTEKSGNTLPGKRREKANRLKLASPGGKQWVIVTANAHSVFTLSQPLLQRAPSPAREVLSMSYFSDEELGTERSSKLPEVTQQT